MTETVVEKTPRRAVGNEEFEAALANSDNANLIRSETLKYAKQMNEDDLRGLGLNALWRALQYHQDGRGQKFTTSLYKFLHWECQRELRRQGRTPVGGRPWT